MKKTTSQIPVITGLLASIGAGLCCAGPFILVSLGVSGAWIANLTLLEPYRPLFIVTVITMFLWGGWTIYRPKEACVARSSCAVPKVKIRRKILFWVAAVISVSLVMSPYLIPLLVA